MADICDPDRDSATTALTIFICIGMVISYLPQHIRIILAKSSEGFSPWFLLLGSTSSASAMFNIIVMQWGVLKCCRVVSAGTCIESTLGIFQLFLQWFLFTLILVLYMMYYPPHLRYVSAISLGDNETGDTSTKPKTAVKSDNWKLSIILSWVVALFILFTGFITFFLLGTNRVESPDTSLPDRGAQIAIWATFLGVLSALLAAMQYAPQIVHTYKLKLVGALSIKMMLIQSPGALLMVLSIALRPGTNWTTWLPYAVAGGMQSILLVMCLFWQRRQHKLQIDDFGNPLPYAGASDNSDSSPVPIRRGTQLEREGVTVAEEVDTAVHTDVRVVHGIEHEITVGRSVSEETPLLADGRKTDGERRAGFWGRLFGK
ncbi:hypothetical protein BXZ70DRAFT_1017211 [Cristinia sonorae]|uniref:PQ loop repeat protein n=1 Tax=Cristinia sonorae TaxID=1940300 RepID=A0A8K0XRE7_9AGAR|nr:hypothetical protein BXZ70DRAFT_1017211 [Cristinia sonorae]